MNGYARLEENYGEDKKECKENEMDGGEYVEYEEERMELPMPSVLTLALLFIS